MQIGRRAFVTGAALTAACSTSPSALDGGARPVEAPFTPRLGPRARAIVVNDISGDIDGLFSTVHAFLSPAAEVRGFVGAAAGGPETVQRSADLANEMLGLMRMAGRIPVHLGSATKLADARTPNRSPGAQAIIDEAMRTDTTQQLFVTVGGGLTEVASALMLEPRIAGKFTLIWIGGAPYPDGGWEFNFNLDPLATQYIFNETTTPLWQVPSNVYATCQVSASEIQAFVAPYGAIGAWLYEKLSRLDMPFNTGETWTMGDSPLVVLSALTAWVPRIEGPPITAGGPRPTLDSLRFDNTHSSQFAEIFAPRVNSDGGYTPRDSGRRIRVYSSIDTRMMFADFYAKLRTNYGR